MNEQKQKSVAKLKELLQGSETVIVFNYSGLNVAGMSALRREFRKREVAAKVARNTLVAVAAEQAGRPQLKPFLGGQVALVTSSNEDVTTVAKAFMDGFKASSLEPVIVGGISSDEALTPGSIITLSKLPPRDVVLARMLAAFNSPISQLAVSFNALLGSLPRALNAVATQKQEAQA